MKGPPPRWKRDQAFFGHPTHSPATKTSATAKGGTKKGRFYKPLQKEFRHGGFDYRQIYREGDLAIYRQTWKGNEDAAPFEVIQIRRHDGFQLGGRWVQPAEVYPRSEKWGELGWTLQNKESAFRKLREINQFQKKKNRRNPVKKSPIQNTDRCPGSIELRGDVNHRRDE